MENNLLIYSSLHVPDKKNERAYIEEIYCSFPECPIFKMGKCIHRKILTRCVYGRTGRKVSPSTMKGKSSREFIRSYRKREEQNELPKFIDGYYSDCMIVISDYVYLPYAHINHSDGKDLGIQFVSHSNFLSSGSEFMKLEYFTPQTIAQMVKLRPQALMGGEIKQYQEKSLPLFLFHLKGIMPDLYNEALKLCPDIEGKTLKTNDVEFLEIPLSYLPKGRYGDSPYVSFGKGAKIESWEPGVLHAYGTKEELDCFSYGLCCQDGKGTRRGNIDIIFLPIAEKTKVKVLKSDLLNDIIRMHPELMNNKK